ncbi:GrpB family protein [Pseudopedobacter beijingensis]|uniref:GrpB family protein n=1 Tax=Pseudopedobacter beijingensis TaxID=1207056 RepID=A0ABW4IEN6_9SPHI
MILPFEPYNPAWKNQFNTLKEELETLLQPIKASVEHIGSTSVEGLAAKPLIDILIGLENEADLDKVPALLQGKNYVYYEKYNEDMPYRRFFVALTDQPEKLGVPAHIGPDDEIPLRLHDHSLRIAHIHTIPQRSGHWLRHIAFREYLRTHPAVKNEYQALKEKLVQQEWEDGNDYNEGKDAFLKEYEKKAVTWYHNQ